MAQCQCSHKSLSVQNRRGQCRWSLWPTDQVTWSRLFKSEHNHANWIALTDRYPNQFNSLRKSFRTGYNGMRDNRKAPLKIFFFPRFPWQQKCMYFLDKYHVCKKNELAEVNQHWQKIFVCNLPCEPAKERQGRKLVTRFARIHFWMGWLGLVVEVEPLTLVPNYCEQSSLSALTWRSVDTPLSFWISPSTCLFRQVNSWISNIKRTLWYESPIRQLADNEHAKYLPLRPVCPSLYNMYRLLYSVCHMLFSSFPILSRSCVCIEFGWINADTWGRLN